MNNRIRDFRERIGLKTQTELAKLLGIKAANISEWEKGTGSPSFAQAKKLFELGITVEELFGIKYKGSSVGLPKVNFSDVEAAAIVKQGLGFLCENEVRR